MVTVTISAPVSAAVLGEYILELLAAGEVVVIQAKG